MRVGTCVYLHENVFKTRTKTTTKRSIGIHVERGRVPESKE